VPCGTLLDSVSCRKALLNTDRLDLQAPDRRALDEAVFDMLGLTAGEREAVYEAVINLVRAPGEGTERVICHNVKGTACRALTTHRAPTARRVLTTHRALWHTPRLGVL